MAYDRYVAICSPPALLHPDGPSGLLPPVGASYLGGCMGIFIVYRLFDESLLLWTNKINHFFCDLFPLVKSFLWPCLYCWDLSHLLSISPHKHTVYHNCVHSYILPLNPEDALHWGEEEGLLDLHLSHLPLPVTFVFTGQFYSFAVMPKSRLFQLIRSKWHLLSTHGGGPHVEHSSQSEEQGGEKRLWEN